MISALIDPELFYTNLTPEEYAGIDEIEDYWGDIVTLNGGTFTTAPGTPSTLAFSGLTPHGVSVPGTCEDEGFIAIVWKVAGAPDNVLLRIEGLGAAGYVEVNFDGTIRVNVSEDGDPAHEAVIPNPRHSSLGGQWRSLTVGWDLSGYYVGSGTEPVVHVPVAPGSGMSEQNVVVVDPTYGSFGASFELNRFYVASGPPDPLFPRWTEEVVADEHQLNRVATGPGWSWAAPANGGSDITGYVATLVEVDGTIHEVELGPDAIWFDPKTDMPGKPWHDVINGRLGYLQAVNDKGRSAPHETYF